MNWITIICLFISFIFVIYFLLHYLIKYREKFYLFPFGMDLETRYKYIMPSDEIIIKYKSISNQNIKLFGYTSKPLSNIKSFHKILLYFHGNAGNIYYRIPTFRQMLNKLNKLEKDDYVLIAFDYRGYGCSSWGPGIDNILEDGLEISKWSKTQFPHNNIYYYGESIGTSIVAYSSMYYPPKGIILKSPFYSMATLIADMYSLPYWLGDYIASNDFTTAKWLISNEIDKHNIPCLIIYNKDDELIPRSNVEKLLSARTQQNHLSIEISGGHNDCEFDDIWHNAVKKILMPEYD
jgi:pimeloyl-ACP methyl ester carboxylesterase